MRSVAAVANFHGRLVRLRRLDRSELTAEVFFSAISRPSRSCGSSAQPTIGRSPTSRPRGSANSQAGLLDLAEANTQLFNPRKLPSILIPAARLPREEKNDPRFRRYLERAQSFIDGTGQLLRSLGPEGAAASVQAARRLELPEGQTFALALLSAMTAQVPELSGSLLSDLAQQLLRYRITDSQLWQALAQSAVTRNDLEPAQLVSLLDSFRRSLKLGLRPSAALETLCQRCTLRAAELTNKQIIGAVASVSRLGNHLSNADQYRALQLLLDRWLANQAPQFEGTPPSQVVSLAVSLTNVSDFLDVRTDNFVEAAADWSLRIGAAPDGPLSAEELVVLLWALKELTSLGLRPHSQLVGKVLPRLQQEQGLKEWSLLRLVQSFEVLLASRHALRHDDSHSDSSVAGESYSEVTLQHVESALSKVLGDAVASDASSAMLARVLALWEQAGPAFWGRCPDLAEAIVSRAIALTSDGEVGTGELHPLLDTMASSSLSRVSSFGGASRAALYSVAAARKDAVHPAMAAAIRGLELEPEANPIPATPTATPAEIRSPATTGKHQSDASLFESLSPLGPAALAERLGRLCEDEASDFEVAATSEALLAVLGGLTIEELVPCLDQVLSGSRRRLARAPLLLEVVERIGDQIAAYSSRISTRQLIVALDWFASVGLPYHLLFESVLLTLLERHQVQGLSWGQAVGVLEAFAAVRLQIPELANLYSHLRRPHGLARLPTMALIRLFSASARLDLLDHAGLDAREFVDRILAETSPHRPLPLEDIVVLIQSLLLSGTVPADKQLRHVLHWLSSTRAAQLSAHQLAVLRQYSLFILAQTDVSVQGVLLRMPVEVQSIISDLLCHRSPAWVPSSSDTTLRFRAEVSGLLEQAGCSAQSGISLGPAGAADMEINGTIWLLDGPEAFFRPFTSDLRYTPLERRRAWLLENLTSHNAARHCVADFYSPALEWPQLRKLKRLSWLEWGKASARARFSLLGLDGVH